MNAHAVRQKMLGIWKELRAHAPFTLFGAATGIACMLLFIRAGTEVNHRLFQVFHPTHVVLSAMVTASLYMLYEKKKGFLAVVVVGYVGAIGVATLSDCVLPFFGETMLGVAVPLHQRAHEHETNSAPAESTAADPDVHDAQTEPSHTEEDEPEHGVTHSETPGQVHEREDHRPRMHLGFIEDWYIVNPAALLGVLIAYFVPRTKFPHAGHVLVSTWASSFHVLMNTYRDLTPLMLVGVFGVLFIAVWLPCCVSDIVFPMLFVRSGVPNVHRHH